MPQWPHPTAASTPYSWACGSQRHRPRSDMWCVRWVWCWNRRHNGAWSWYQWIKVKVWLGVWHCGPTSPSFRLRGTSPSCQQHRKRATPTRRWPSRNRWLLSWFSTLDGLVWCHLTTNVPTFSASRVNYPMYLRNYPKRSNDHTLYQRCCSLVLVDIR